MMEDQSGPAFPLHVPEWHEAVNQQGFVHHDFTMGMSLRDYFAAKVLQVMCEDFLPTEAATSAYEYADAMLKARGE
jgi:hypothetical protein